MKCPECQKQGLKSRIDVGTSTTTQLTPIQYYDEDGNYHYDDPNTTTTSYSCTNGHSWSETHEG